MSPSDTENRIIKNEFIFKIRSDHIVDRKAYSELCSLLRKLAQEWRGKRSVRKDVAQHLYGLAQIAQNLAERFRDMDPDFYSEVFDMSIELDALILDAFHDPDE